MKACVLASAMILWLGLTGRQIGLQVNADLSGLSISVR